ncbi:MAG TPA: hypothetical protein VK212_06325 [Lentimicrobium sp.]|nr:hypothetical protein [Lentimicrobium sp.]
MKPKHYLFSLMLISAFISFSLLSCNKEKDEKEGKDDYTSISSLSQDELSIEEATDESMTDVEQLLAGNAGNNKSAQDICNATIDSTEVVNDTITYYITYDGLSCDGKRLRTGQVEVRKHVNTHFGLPGAQVNVKHINFSVTRVQTGQTIIINSNKTFTNVTGAFVFMLGYYNIDTVIHKIEGSAEITFGNNNTRSWNIARQVTFTGTAGAYVLTCEGFGSSGNYSNLSNWGTNRNGELFYTQITQPVILKQTCDWNPCSGVKVHQIPAMDKSATVTFGFNSSYQLVTGDECPTHYRVDWVNGDYTGQFYWPLP